VLQGVEQVGRLVEEQPPGKLGVPVRETAFPFDLPM
jgi:hypothetical protein